MKLNFSVPLGMGLIAAIFTLFASLYNIYYTGLNFKDGFFFVFGVGLISLAVYLLIVPIKENGITE